MSYGLKYRLSFDSVSDTPYEINILEAGYDGPVENRNLGSAPVLKMDDGEAVRGTSLELSIETCFDGDLREFYTTDRKKFRVEVYRSGVLFWSGHILPELYSEPYISVPFDVSVTASDGLGLLKNIPFGLSGKRSVFDVIKYCCEQTGLVLNYVFASKLLATGMSGVASVYTQAFVDCNAFDDADCYEALEKVLITFGSYIKQKDCKWHVLRYTDQDTDLMEYDPSCNFAGGFRPVMKTLGAIGDDTYPVGQLESEIVPARKDFTMEQPYELYPSLLKDYCFAAVGSWILSPGVRFMRVDEETYCELKPTKLPEKLEAYVMQSISVEACNRPFRIEFQFSICLMSNREIGSIDMSTGRSFRLEIFITDSGGTRHYLSAEGWGTKETYIEVRGDVQNGKLRITDGVNYDYIPASFETFRINLERIPYSGEMAFRIINPYKYYTVPGTPAFDDYNDMNIICLKEFVFTSDVDGNPDVNVLLNPEASTSAPSLKVGFVDAPFTENARGIFKNILMTSGGFTSEWYCRGSGLDSFANIALQDMSSRIGVPSFCLHGVIHATDFDLLSDKYSGRKLYLKEYSYDLMEEEIDCTLCELLPFNAGIDGEITQSPRSSNKSKTETRASGETEYRSYGGTISTPKMIRELVSMPDDQLSEGCLLEVDDRMSVSSKRVAVGGLTDLSYKRVLQSGVFWTKEEMNCTDGYLEVQGEKIKAGDSDKWNAHEFDDFLDQPVRKTDSVQFKQVTADKITTDEIISDNFVSGPLGEGMNLIRRDSSGKSYLEIDKIFARYKAVFAALEIRKLTYAGGNYIFSPAGATCTMVEDKEGFYRCYFTADDGEKAVENLFRTDDFVQCRESNIKSGTYENISNRYYWRRCIATGDDYIDLSKSDCDTDSDIPAIGDSMVTIGNKTVSTRQNAIIISVYGEGSPSFIQYKGINTFSLEGKAKIIISPDQNRFTGKFTFETGEDAEESIGNIQNNLDNLQVGETNLLDNSNKGWKNTGYPIATIYLGDYKPKQGEECTIVIKGKLGANKTSWGVYNSGGSVVLASFYPGGPDTDYIALKTFKWTLGTPAVDNTFIRIYPIPNNEINEESEIEWVKLVLGNKTSLLWTPSINDQRQIAIDEAGKVVDGIQIGGVNILIGSTTGTGWTGYTEHKDTEFSIKDASTRESYIRSAMITIPGNKEIVVSFYAKHTGHQNYFDFYILPASYPEIDALLTSSYQSGTDWTYNEFKFTTPSDWGEGTLVYLRIDHNGMSDGSEFIISVKDVQIEYGNKATTYSVPESDRKEIAKQQGLEGGQEAVNGLQIGSQNLISKKMMLKWNEKNKDIAVWGQDEDGIYLDVTPKLLFNNITTISVLHPVFDITFKPKSQYVFSIEWKHKSPNPDNTGLAFYIEYDDGTRSNVFLTKDIKTKTITNVISSAGKTISKIYSGYGNGDINALIYNISLIEGNKPLQGFPVAEEDQTGANNVNLADGTKEFTIGVGSTNYTYKELYVSKIKPNTVYYVNAGNIQNLVGNPDRYSFVLYNKDVSTVLCPTLNADKNGGFLITYNNFTEQEGRLLCYAGIAGSTLGNSVKFTEVMLVEGFLPAPVWTPSFSEQQAEIKTITETLTEIKAENGEISLRVNEVSERVEEAKQEAIDEAKEYTTIQTYRETDIDLRAEKWDQDTYYPVTIKLTDSETRIEIVTIWAASKPEWSTHESGFSMNCVWRSNGSGWGAFTVKRTIEVFEYRFTKEIPDTTPVQYILPAGSIGQLTSSSEELIYLRGGGRYLFKIGNNCVAVVHDSRYTAPDGTAVAPVTSVIRPVLTNVMKTEFDSQITQLKNSINLRVTKTDYDKNNQVLNQSIGNLQTSYNSISGTVSSLNTRLQTVEKAGYITTSQGNTLYASKKLENGNELISYINQDATNTTIKAKNINLNGAISANGNIRITTDGKLIAVNGQFTGKITATEGEIAGLKLSNNGLRSSDFNASSKVGSCYAKNGFSVYASGSGVLAPSTGALQAGIITAIGTNSEIIGLEIIAKNTSGYATLSKITALKLRAIDYVDDSKKMAPTAALIVEEGVSIFSGEVEVNEKSTFNGAVYFKNVQNVNGKSNYYLCIDRSTGQLYYR
ncbi:hypothetical protein [Odoribacter splanchnicus]|uniref:hypothetical protein n=2 Tax=Odoribacter splanchnicus TaxID=28118 RepID=UPI00307A9DA0